MAGVDGFRNPACGHIVQPGTRFCPFCGQTIPDSAIPPESSTTPMPAVPSTPPPTRPQSDPWDSWYAPGSSSAPPPSGPPVPLPPPPSSAPPSAPRSAPPPAPLSAPVPTAQSPWPSAPNGGPPDPWPGPGGTNPYAAQPADPFATRVDADPFATRVDGAGPPPPPHDNATSVIGALHQARTAPPPSGPRRPGGRLLPVIAAGAALVIVVAGFLLFRQHTGNNTASGTTTSTPTPTASAVSQAARRQAAVTLSALLAQSVTDRGDVIDAVVNVRGCGKALDHDASVFTKAANSRQRLLSKLSGMPGRALLSASMLSNLTGAWRASAQADSYLAKWTNAKIVHGCHTKAGNADLSASYVPDGQATTYKKSFATLWDPVATRYGLTAYQWDQL